MSNLLEKFWDSPVRWWLWPVLVPLWCVSVVLRTLTLLRNRAYDLGIFPTVAVSGAKVVSVGNLRVGGTGKTPFIIYLVNEAIKRGYRVAVVTRGYGRRTKGSLMFKAENLPPVADCGDEPRLIAQRCSGVWVCVGSDKAEMAQRAAAELKVNFILVDDGFQHRRLVRQFDWVLLTGKEEQQSVLPLGPLRESYSNVFRAHAVIVPQGHGDMAPLMMFNGEILVRCVIDSDGKEHPPSWLVGRRIFVLSGIARSYRFVDALKRQSALIVDHASFSDHHVFTPSELAVVREQARELDADIVTTQKDAQRLQKSFAAAVVVVDFELQGEVERFWTTVGN